MNAPKIIGGGGAGAGIGAAVVYIADRFGAHLNAEDGALITTGAIALCAFIVHNGLLGSLKLLLHGSASPTPPPAA